MLACLQFLDSILAQSFLTPNAARVFIFLLDFRHRLFGGSLPSSTAIDKRLCSRFLLWSSKMHGGKHIAYKLSPQQFEHRS
jgi:hypothetical protein